MTFHFPLEVHKQFTQALPFPLYMNHITGAVSSLSDLSIVGLFKESHAEPLPGPGQGQDQKLVTSR